MRRHEAGAEDARREVGLEHETRAEKQRVLEKLRSIVSTPAGGKSLNEAVRSEIDTSSMRFERGFAFVVSKDGTLRVENGVVRGDAVGATFQGMVRNASGQMEMTGTFMPAYGLNRLFANEPASDAHVLALSWKAQQRLHQRWQRLDTDRGKRRTIVAVAVARELAGFCWAIATAD